MHVEVIHSGGLYAERVVAYLSAQGAVTAHQVPSSLPLIVDDPEEFLPIPDSRSPIPDVIVAINLHRDLLVEIPRRTRTRALIAPIEDPSWIKAGLQRQVTQLCAPRGIETAFPKPFCALVPKTPVITEFCEQYRAGVPRFTLHLKNGLVTAVDVDRGSPCSIATFIASQLVGTPADDLLPQRAGHLHHAYPCLATMNLDPDTGDTIMHASLHLLRAQVTEALQRARGEAPPPDE